MSVPLESEDLPQLPEQELLASPDSLRAFGEAFLRGEIDAARYSELTLAELSTRASTDPTVELADPALPSSPVMRLVEPVIRPGDTAPRF